MPIASRSATSSGKGGSSKRSRRAGSDFDVWAKKVSAGDTQNIYKELATSGKAGFAITRPLAVAVMLL